MKEKVTITILVIILGVLIVRLGIKRFHTDSNVEQQETSNPEVIKVMAEMENQNAYDKYLEQMYEQSESSSCSSEYLLLEDLLGQENESLQAEVNSTSDRIGVDGSEKLPEYCKLYPDLYVDKICPECNDKTQKVAFLTFDDGPSKNTGKILDILAEKKAVATFFVLGSTMTEEGEEALKRMTDMGCKIGIHTYSHNRKVIYSSVKGFLDDFYKVYTQINEITGEKPNIFRFPWGSYNSFSKPIKKSLVAEMDRRGFTYFDWNVSAEDAVGKPTEYSIMKNVMKDVKKYNQPVILMHDGIANKLTVRMLPSVIDKLIELGYSFGTLDQREPCQFCW